MIRSWAAKFNKALSKRSSSRRKELKVPIKLTFEPDRNTGSLTSYVNKLSIVGETSDFSTTGVAFVVASIRLQEFYLVGEGRLLKGEITLPNGIVRMKLMGQRYEQTGQHLSVTQYVVGAKIVDMSNRDRMIYDEFLKGTKGKLSAFTLETEES